MRVSSFYDDPSDLVRLDWPVIGSRTWNDTR